MAQNAQSRQWLLTINNPLEKGFDHAVIQEKLLLFSPTYYCFSDELAPSGTYHTHVYLYSKSPIRFSTIKNRFPESHIEQAYGTPQDNRDYIRKEGKWADTDKAKTSIVGTFEEWGQLPPEKAEKSPELYQLIKDIQNGLDTTTILENTPKLALRAQNIEHLRQAMLYDKFTTQTRDLDVTYIYGDDEIENTSYLYKKHPAKDIYRLTNYRSGKGVYFDGYINQDILLLEHFDGQIPINELLNYLSDYPLFLPCRYMDRTACYTKVYITAAIPLEAQYIKEYNSASWHALGKKIHNIIFLDSNGIPHILKQKGKCK